MAQRHIVEDLLTLKCPSCRAAFLDFTGCFLLSCHRCKCQFCGWCLAANQDHHHVAGCTHNATPDHSVYATPQQFERAQVARREREVGRYLQSIDDARVRDKVLAGCAQSFADLGVDVKV
jgi:hypothetical protein